MKSKILATIMLAAVATTCNVDTEESRVGVEVHQTPVIPGSDEPSVYATIDTKPVYVTDTVNQGWAVAEALDVWNEAIGCEYFYLVDNPRYSAVIIDQYSSNDGGLGYTLGNIIKLNIYQYPESRWSGPHLSVTIHELGHILGIDHTESIIDVMYAPESGTGEPQAYLPVELSDNDLHELSATGYTYCHRVRGG